MTDFEAFIGLNLVGDIGSIRLRKLLGFFGKPQNILLAPADKLMMVEGVGEAIASRITALNQQDIDREFALAKKHDLLIVSSESPEYPPNLKFIDDPPIILYMKGTIKPEDTLSIAIVGSRHASFYGLSHAEKFARELSGLGFTIVSGMARGIDTCAHRGALKSAGRTIAVIGSGFEQIYPPENKALAAQIAQHGCVISEFPITWAPMKQNFPRRNRVISGLSLGVLIVEAARNSGALITAGFALEQGREVFALPGNIDRPTSFGCHELLKQGAKLVSSIDDIVEEMPSFFASRNETTRSEEVPAQGLSCTERLLYTIISSQASSLDELAEKSLLSIPEIASALLKLQLSKRIKQGRAGQFIRSQDA